MAHASVNYKTKKALKEAVVGGKAVYVTSPGFFPPAQNGPEVVEGPWEFHRWYASVRVENGRIVSVK